MGEHTSKQAVAREQGRSPLGALIHAAVREAIEAAVEAEVAATLGAGRYERRDTRQGYRNGTKTRTLSGPTGALALTLPRATMATGTGRREWTSTVVPRYQRRLQEINTAVLATYLAGGNTRRIRGALAPLLHGAPLSRSAVSRIVATLKSSLEAWQRRPLGDLEVVYAYLDALALRGRSGGKVVGVPVLAVVGVLADGQKVLVELDLCGGRVVRGVEGLPGQPRRAGAESPAALHHRRPRRLAARRGRGLGAGGGAALLRPQVAELGAQGPEARPR
jgi:transposase-like protein